MNKKQNELEKIEKENYASSEDKKNVGPPPPQYLIKTIQNSSPIFYNEEIVNERCNKIESKKQSSDINYFKFKNNYYYLAQSILKGCEIYLSVKKLGDINYLTIIRVLIGLNKLTINVDKFRNYLKSSMEIKNNNDIFIDNSFNFANFITQFEERIVEEYKNNFEVNLKIKIENNNKFNSDNFFNLDALYTFYPPSNDKPLEYKEENILLNGTESKLQGFNLMMIDLNQEKFKNII